MDNISRININLKRRFGDWNLSLPSGKSTLFGPIDTASPHIQDIDRVKQNRLYLMIERVQSPKRRFQIKIKNLYTSEVCIIMIHNSYKPSDSLLGVPHDLA